MQLSNPLLASGQGAPFMIVDIMFLLGGGAGLFQGLRRHPVGYAIGVAVTLAFFGYLLIGSFGLLTPSALAAAYLWGRYA